MHHRLGIPALPLLLLLAGCCASAEDTTLKPCTGRNGGKYYDLNGLKASSDYTLKTPGGGRERELILNACKAVSHETWGLKMDDVPDPATVAGFVRREHGDFSIGTLNTTLTFSARSGYPHLTFSSGSKCVDADGKKVDSLRASTEIEFVCDPAADRGAPRLIASLPPGSDDSACAFVFEWRTVSACPTSEGVGFFAVLWFLVSSVLVVLAAYLVIGTLYNYFALGLSGMEALPRFSVAGLVHHTREAVDVAREWCAGAMGGGRFGLRDGGGRNGGGGFGAGSGGGRAFRDAEGAHGEHYDDDSSSTPKTNPAAFIRTRKDPSQLNPASHQNQTQNQTAPAPPVLNTHSVSASPSLPHSPIPTAAGLGLNPASHQAQVMAAGQGQALADMPMPMPIPRTNTGTGTGGMNPASHQAQAQSAAQMPVPHLSRTPSAQGQGQGLPPLTPGRERFALGEEEGDDGDYEDGEEEDLGAEGEEGGGRVRL
ncbi:hypothetical protein C8F01DRAFT_1375682 [Mycena amicta]|nr:hypothetical protein C8F01DRAFT_1375682 [Mycena amicta]